MKKLMILGGGINHILFIKKAVEMGYYTITCDYFENNPGHKFAHEYHNVSYMDRDRVLALAKELKIDGITCFSADEAMTTVSYVAEKLGLPSYPSKSIEIINNKHLFREFLKNNNFHVPKAKSFTSYEEAKYEIDDFNLPVMIKPVDSSGSRGISKITKITELEEKVEYALNFSKKKRFIIEEYIEKKGYQVGGDGFSVDGELVFRCFTNNHLDSSHLNPFIPIGGSWPSILPEHIQSKIHKEIQRLIDLLGMKTGPYNFDIRLDKNDHVYFIEMGARTGGNLIPIITKYATGVDLIEYTIKAALGEDCSELKMIEPEGFWSCYIINSQKNGIFEGIEIDSEFEKNNVVEYALHFKNRDQINAFTGTDKKLGEMVLKYSSKKEMLEKMENINKYIKVHLNNSLVY